MLLSARTARRAVAGAVGTGALAGAMLFGALPSAMAVEPPNCTAADLAFTAAGVSQATSDYLFSHQDDHQGRADRHPSTVGGYQESLRRQQRRRHR